jgi:hypothetical protein
MSWLLNNFKTPSPPRHRLHRWSVTKKAIIERKAGAGQGVKSSAFKSTWKTNRPWLDLRRVEQDDHEHPWPENKKVDAMSCTLCPVSYPTQTRPRVGLVSPHSGCQTFRIGSVTSHELLESSQFHCSWQHRRTPRSHSTVEGS